MQDSRHFEYKNTFLFIPNALQGNTHIKTFLLHQLLQTELFLKDNFSKLNMLMCSECLQPTQY